jgi:hypothetical protein
MKKPKYNAAYTYKMPNGKIAIVTAHYRPLLGTYQLAFYEEGIKNLGKKAFKSVFLHPSKVKDFLREGAI